MGHLLSHSWNDAVAPKEPRLDCLLQPNAFPSFVALRLGSDLPAPLWPLELRDLYLLALICVSGSLVTLLVFENKLRVLAEGSCGVSPHPPQCNMFSVADGHCACLSCVSLSHSDYNGRCCWHSWGLPSPFVLAKPQSVNNHLCSTLEDPHQQHT